MDVWRHSPGFLLLLSQQCLLTSWLDWVEATQEEPGYCQIYSYNIHDSHTQSREKHYFVCCNNHNEVKCKGHTYQKPSRTESFCTGQVIQREGSHWTQMETELFPEDGRFYCGGCCGQRLAADACHKTKDHWRGCSNWVQCMQHQCKTVVAEVIAKHPLDCSLPPPPHPKHYWQETRTVPTNLSLHLVHPTEQTKHTRASNMMSATNSTCTVGWCQALSLGTRCRTECCQPYCCLPDGPPQFGVSPLFWGLSTLQVAGVVVGSLALLAAMAGIFMLGVKRCVPGCQNIHLRSDDSHVLVIEGPDDIDSDPDSG